MYRLKASPVLQVASRRDETGGTLLVKVGVVCLVRRDLLRSFSTFSASPGIMGSITFSTVPVRLLAAS